MTPAHLRTLLQAGTPGPWEIGDLTPQHNDVALVRGIQIRGAYKAVACRDDAALLVALHNHAEALLEVVEAAINSRNPNLNPDRFDKLDAALARLAALPES